MTNGKPPKADADTGSRAARTINNVGRILLALVVLYFGWETYLAYRNIAGGNAAKSTSPDATAASQHPEADGLDIIPFDFLSGGWQFEEVPWYVSMARSDAETGIRRALKANAPDRTPAARSQSDLDRSLIEVIEIFGAKKSKDGRFTRREVLRDDTEIVVYTSAPNDDPAAEIVESVFARVQFGGHQTTEVRLDYRSPESTGATRLLPLPEQATILATRTDSGRRKIGDLVTYAGELDALFAFWRSEGYSVRLMPSSASLLDMYVIERDAESFGVRPMGMMDSEQHALMIVRTTAAGR